MPLRLALVGFGYWGRNLAKNLHYVLGTDWVACVDAAPSGRAAAQRLYPWLKIFASIDELLANDCVDGIVIATPARAHAAQTEHALLAGKHVLVEKPLAVTLRDAERVTSLAEASGLTLMVGHTFEYNPAVLHMKRMIQDGDLGDVLYLHSQRVNLGRLQTDINAMWSIGPHDVSIANFLLDAQPDWVAAKGAKYLHNDIADVVFATLGYPNGVLAHIHVSWLDPSKVRRTTLVGSKKMVVYDDIDSEARIRVYDKGADKMEGGEFGEFQFRVRTGDMHVPKIDLTEPLRLEIEHFIESIACSQPVRSDGRNGSRVVAVLEAIDKSLSNGGSEVHVDPLRGGDLR